MMTKMNGWALSGCLLMAVGCAGKSLDAGSNRDGGMGAVSVEGVRREYPPPSHSFGCVPGDPQCYGRPCVGEVPAGVAGVWKGEFDNHELSSGSQRIEIEFLGRGGSTDSNGLCGTVTFGDGAPPPVPTDPEEWPPGLPETNAGPSRDLVEGFVYEFWFETEPDVLAKATSVDLVVPLFSVQPYKAWCQLQYSYPTLGRQSMGFSCLPPHLGVTLSPFESADCSLQLPPLGEDNWQPISCAQANLCESACQCTEGGCSIGNWNSLSTATQPDILCSFEASSDVATGSIITESGSYSFYAER